MKDYLIYIDDVYTGIKRGPNVDAIIETFAYTKVEYVSHEDTSKGVDYSILKDCITCGPDRKSGARVSALPNAPFCTVSDLTTPTNDGTISTTTTKKEKTK